MYPAIFPGQEQFKTKMCREALRFALEGSLKRLQTDYVDIYYLHRIPEGEDLKEIALLYGKLIKEGKIRGWGLSQATPEQIRLAHSVTPLSAVQNEYSMMERMYQGSLEVCNELGIGFVPFSPMASGFLSGKYTASTKYTGDDVRRVITRFEPENVRANQPVLDLVHKYAEAKGCTPAQIALAFTLYLPCSVPIPGMRSDARIEENLGAARVHLTAEEMAALTAELDKLTIHGNRTDADIGNCCDKF